MRQKGKPMNKEHRYGLGFFKPAVVALLSLTFLVPALGAGEKRGARLLIEKKDGAVIKGELLTVKEENLILMEESSSNGVTVNLQDVKSVKIVNRGRAVLILECALGGAAVGAVAGFATGTRSQSVSAGVHKTDNTLLGAGAGVAVGALLGILATSTKTLEIDNGKPGSIPSAISQLRLVARDSK